MWTSSNLLTDTPGTNTTFTADTTEVITEDTSGGDRGQMTVLF